MVSHVDSAESFIQSVGEAGRSKRSGFEGVFRRFVMAITSTEAPWRQVRPGSLGDLIIV